MIEEVKVKTWSMNETRRFRKWLRRLKGKKIRIIEVHSTGNYVTSIKYEVYENE